jgi:hypothetical protein
MDFFCRRPADNATVATLKFSINLPSANNPVVNFDPDGLNWYRNNTTGEVVWFKGHEDVEGYSNIGVYYVHEHNGNKVYHIQNEVVSKTEYEQATAPAQAINRPYDPFRLASANTQAGLGRTSNPTYLYNFADKSPEYLKMVFEGLFFFEMVLEKGAEGAILYVGKKLTQAQINKGIASLQKQIEKHRQKLEEYMKNPDAYDNKGFLKNISETIREKIIQTRIKGLQKEIQKFENEIQKLINK